MANPATNRNPQAFHMALWTLASGTVGVLGYVILLTTQKFKASYGWPSFEAKTYRLVSQRRERYKKPGTQFVHVFRCEITLYSLYTSIHNSARIIFLGDFLHFCWKMEDSVVMSGIFNVSVNSKLRHPLRVPPQTLDMNQEQMPHLRIPLGDQMTLPPEHLMGKLVMRKKKIHPRQPHFDLPLCRKYCFYIIKICCQMPYVMLDQYQPQKSNSCPSPGGGGHINF